MPKISEYSPATEPLQGDEVIVLNQGGDTFNTTISGIITSLPSQYYLGLKENILGNPNTDNQFLTSTISGTRFWKPIEGSLDYFSENYKQDGSLVLDDLVYQSGFNREVVKAINNNSNNPIIGVVTDVISSTDVTVTYLGVFDIPDNVLEGQKVFISSSGTVTSDLPSVDYVQVLGHAVTTNRIYFNPAVRRTKRNVLGAY